MSIPTTDAGRRADGAGPAPVPHPSPRVRLEAALLDADRATHPPAPPPDEGPCPTVLVVAAEADLRRYVGECLRERPALRCVEAATVDAAVALAARYPAACLVVDGPERAALGALSSHRAVLLVDEVPRGAFAAGRRVGLLACPFSAEQLLSALAALGE